MTDKDIIKGMRREHDRLIVEGRRVEDENARLEAENRRLRRSGASVSGLLIDAVGTGSDVMVRLEAEVARLVLALEEARKSYAIGPLGEPFFKTKVDAEKALETVERECDSLSQQLREHQNCDPHRDCPPNAPCGMEASDGKTHGRCAALGEKA